MEHLYIVVYRQKPDGRWKSFSEGEFTERRLAGNFIECKRAAGWSEKSFDMGIVEGPIVNPGEMAAAEAALGEF